MKKFISILTAAGLLSCGTCFTGFTVKNENGKLAENCKSAYLIDYNSAECIYKENETARMPIASVCKVMTLTLAFDSISEGKLSLNDTVTVSDNASGMGGSQVFLGSGCKYTVDNLLKSIVVCSANDSCVAIAETVGGSEEKFVSKMNEKAKELGCADTLFANCTGLPREPQYSCAKDVALMFRNLLTHENYFNYSKIWLEDFVHPDNRTTSMTNTNKLIKKYSFCDGGKTGFTNEAGFCLACTAKKDNLRLISVILGADSSDSRFSSTINLFNYGFSNYKNKIVLDKEIILSDEFEIIGGKKKTFTVCPARNSYVFSATDKSPDVTFNIIPDDVHAPVTKGQSVGKIEVYKDGLLYETVELVSAEDISKANYGDYIKIVADEWAM